MTYCANEAKGPCHCQPQEGVFCPFDAGVATTQRETEVVRSELTAARDEAEELRGRVSELVWCVTLGQTDSYILRKQAEAVEGYAPYMWPPEDGYPHLKLFEYVKRLRQQADELERPDGRP